MAWMQSVSLVLQRSATLTSLRTAGLSTTLNHTLNNINGCTPLSALLRNLVHKQSFSVVASLEEDDESPEPEFEYKPPGRGINLVEPSAENFEASKTELARIFQTKQVPSRDTLTRLIDSACTEEHVDEVLELLKKLKVERAFRREQLSPLQPQISIALALACARAGVPEKGLVTVLRRNPCGLRPALDAAQVLMAKAGNDENVALVKKIFRTLLLNGIHPRPNTANLVMKAVSEERHSRPLEFFRFAEEFFMNGVPLWPAWYEKLLVRAMMMGDFDLFRKWAHRREAGGIPMTKRIGFIIAKGHVMAGDAEKAANVLARAHTFYLMDKLSARDAVTSQWDMACKQMVTEWPSFLARVRKEQVDFDKMKATLLELQKLLRAQNVRFEVNVAAVYNPFPDGAPQRVSVADRSAGGVSVTEAKEGELLQREGAQGATSAPERTGEEGSSTNEESAEDDNEKSVEGMNGSGEQRKKEGEADSSVAGSSGGSKAELKTEAARDVEGEKQVEQSIASPS